MLLLLYMFNDEEEKFYVYTHNKGRCCCIILRHIRRDKTNGMRIPNPTTIVTIRCETQALFRRESLKTSTTNENTHFYANKCK